MNKDELLTLLVDLDITYKKTEHEPVMTVAEAAAVRGVIPGLACKCLFLRSKDERLWLAAFPSSMRADLKALALALRCPRLSFAPEALLQPLLGLKPGAVSLFGAINDSGREVTTVLEASLLDAALICLHPLVNTATLSLSPADMIRFLHYAGHDPRIVRLSVAEVGG